MGVSEEKTLGTQMLVAFDNQLRQENMATNWCYGAGAASFVLLEPEPPQNVYFFKFCDI
jgi:hypothetical protein